MRLLAGALELVSKVTRARPLIDRSQVDELAGKYACFDSSKAERELGYRFLPAREVPGRTVGWLVERGFVSGKRRSALHPDPSLQAAA